MYFDEIPKEIHEETRIKGEQEMEMMRMTELQKANEKDVKFLAGQEGEIFNLFVGQRRVWHRNSEGAGNYRNDAGHERAPDSRFYQGGD